MTATLLDRLSSPHPAALLCWALVSSAAVSPVQGLGADRASGEEAYTEEQRITAVDTMVEIVDRKGGPSEAARSLPSYLAPEDFEVVDQGEPRRVIDVGVFGPAQKVPDSEPWTFVIYFDRTLASPAETSWAAGELVEAAGRLTDLGEVEVVVADPEPRTILNPTRDTERLASVLAEIALFPAGRDHRLLVLRDEFLGEVANPDSEIDPVELAAFAVGEERRLVTRQMDALLTCAVATEAGARRGLLLVTSGFDLRPEDFYRAHGLPPKRVPPPAETSDPESVLEAVSHTLAAYGWITFPLVPPAEEASAGGLWLGKWRLGAPQGASRESAVDPLHPEETAGPVALNFLNLTRSAGRDREKAQAYFELAATLTAKGDYEEAEQALRLALYHWEDDRATLDKQVEALRELGRVLELEGRPREARAALERARELDAESGSAAGSPAAGPPLGELLDPAAPLLRLAEASGGRVLRSREVLLESLAGLTYRVRVTFQVSGAADGSLHPVEVRCVRKGCRVRAPAWIRSGTPREVAASRMRRWLSDDQFDGDFELQARWAPGGDAIELEAAVPPGLAAGALANLRVTLGEGDPESIGELRHGELRQEIAAPRLLSDPERWTLTVALSGAPTNGAVAVLVDHLESGRWGAALVERPEGLPEP